MKKNTKAYFICKELFTIANVIAFVIGIVLTILGIIFINTADIKDSAYYSYLKTMIILIIISYWSVYLVSTTMKILYGKDEYKSFLRDEENKKKYLESINDNEIVKPIEKVKKKKFYIEIYFNDGSEKGYNSTYPFDTKQTYITHFYDFYKWYFYRDSSDIYSFKHRLGADVFYKKDIKRVSFREEIVEE